MPNRNQGRQLQQPLFSDLPPPPLPPVPSTPTIGSNRQLGAAGLHSTNRRGTPSVGSETTPDVRYTVYLRLPFPRNGFVDPPPVDWDASKERSLWRVISGSRNSELDWNLLAEHFHVSAPFLLQQVAWLYERELSQVRAQLRKVGNVSVSGAAPSNASSTPGATQRVAAVATETLRPISLVTNRPLGIPMSRTSSRNVSNYPPLSPVAKAPATTATPMVRTISGSTARPAPSQSSQYFPATLQNPEHLQQQSNRVPPKLNTTHAVNTSPTTIRRSSPTSPSSSSSSKSSDGSSSVDRDGLIQKRRPFRRFGTSSRVIRDPNEETDEEESPAFLPWTEGVVDGAASAPGDETDSANPPPTSRQRKGPKLRQNVGGYEPSRRDNTSVGTVKRGLQQTNIQPNAGYSDSGASTPGSGSSPRRRVPADAKRGNESSPSMGSSFSDLSDASVTQSALEDQFLSAVGAGGSMVSRMSTLSQAFRGRQQ